MKTIFDKNVFGLVALFSMAAFGLGMPVYFLLDPVAFTADYFTYSLNYYSALWALMFFLAYVLACRMIWRSTFIRENMRWGWFFIISFFSISMTITTYASVYYSVQAVVVESLNEQSAMYFSVLTFTSLSFGDLVPHADYRLLVASEAILGYMFLGGFAGFLAGLLVRSRK